MSGRPTRTPGWSFFMGVPVTAAVGLWIAIASASGIGPLIGTAWLMGFAWMALGTIGAAGLSRVLGERLSALSAPTSNLTTLVRGAVVYELACIFPIVGWFFFAPLVGVTVVGAAVYGLLGWEPRGSHQSTIDLIDNSAGLAEQIQVQ